jgi:hypothetical protein
MAGYFYNDGNVAEVRELSEIAQKARAGPVLVLCGPKERRQIEAAPDLTAVVLAYGPKGNALLRVAARAGPS